MAGSLPPPLMVSEVGSFAEYTIVHRKPQIIADILATNRYGPGEVAALQALAAELATESVQPLQEQTEDTAFWWEAWLPWQGKTWRELSWFFAETYFYRRILECVGYFQPGPCYLQDPFAAQKRRALAEGLRQLASFYPAVPEGISLREDFTLRLHRSLWGNRFDLSNVQAIVEAHRLHREGTPDDLLLIDHTGELWDLLRVGRVRCMDVVADNSGLELLSDLAMLDLLLAHGLLRRVRLHLKPQPFFVSDAMIRDFEATQKALETHSLPALRSLGARLSHYREMGQLAVHTHPFWAKCLFFDRFPTDLADMLGESDLILCKGDVNYRRLLQDRHWPPTEDLADVASFMPAPFVALRTLKGELIVGLPEGLAESVARRDPTWLINGKRGVIHLVHPRR